MARRRRRRPKDESLGSLDSLLDTMTTVVGILLIILIVLQLDVSKAVERIVREESDTGPKVEQKDLDKRQQEIDALRKTIADKTQKREKTIDVAAALSTKQKSLEAKLAALAASLNRTKTPKSTAELKKLEAKLAEELKKLNQQITATGVRYKELRALLAQTPVPVKAPPNTITIPKPRPAPKDATPVRYFCRGGKVYPHDEVELRKIVAEAVKKSGVKPHANREYDPSPIIAYFKKRDIGNKHFRLEAFVHTNKALSFRMHRRRSGGTPAAMLSNFNSTFRTGLRNVNPRKNYVLCRVWPDSFKTYSTMRKYLDRAKIPAGWEAREDKTEWHAHLGWYPVHGRKALEEANAAKAAANPPPKKPPAKPAPPKNVLD